MSESKVGIAQIVWPLGDENPTLRFCYGGFQGNVTGKAEEVYSLLKLMEELNDRARTAEEAMREIKHALDEVLV